MGVIRRAAPWRNMVAGFAPSFTNCVAKGTFNTEKEMVPIGGPIREMSDD